MSGTGSLTEYLLKAASLFITEPNVKNTDFAIWRLEALLKGPMDDYFKGKMSLDLNILMKRDSSYNLNSVKGAMYAIKAQNSLIRVLQQIHERQVTKITSELDLLYNMDRYLTQTSHGKLTKLGMLLYTPVMIITLVLKYFSVGLLYAMMHQFLQLDPDYSNIKLF